jgi:hypothetical protein
MELTCDIAPDTVFAFVYANHAADANGNIYRLIDWLLLLLLLLLLL